MARGTESGKVWVGCAQIKILKLYIYMTLKADRLHPRDYSTHRQPWTDNVSSLLFAALGKAKPLISIGCAINLVKRFKQDSINGQTYGSLYRLHYLPALLSYAVDKNTWGICSIFAGLNKLIYLEEPTYTPFQWDWLGLSVSPLFRSHSPIPFRELIFTEPEIIATPSVNHELKISIIMQVCVKMCLNRI